MNSIGFCTLFLRPGRPRIGLWHSEDSEDSRILLIRFAGDDDEDFAFEDDFDLEGDGVAFRDGFFLAEDAE